MHVRFVKVIDGAGFKKMCVVLRHSRCAPIMQKKTLKFKNKCIFHNSLNEICKQKHCIEIVLQLRCKFNIMSDILAFPIQTAKRTVHVIRTM